MALTDPNALTGTISICVNKDNGIPEYKDFFPKTETSQITDFNEATIDLINHKVSSLVPTVYAYKTTLLTTMWHDSDNPQFPKQYVINNDLISENDIKLVS